MTSILFRKLLYLALIYLLPIGVSSSEENETLSAPILLISDNRLFAGETKNITFRANTNDVCGYKLKLMQVSNNGAIIKELGDFTYLPNQKNQYLQANWDDLESVITAPNESRYLYYQIYAYDKNNKYIRKSNIERIFTTKLNISNEEYLLPVMTYYPDENRDIDTSTIDIVLPATYSLEKIEKFIDSRGLKTLEFSRWFSDSYLVVVINPYAGNLDKTEKFINNIHNELGEGVAVGILRIEYYNQDLPIEPPNLGKEKPQIE